jgi:general secretion pathway protein H
MKSQRGFSLVELIVVMVLIAVLAGIGAAAISSGLPGQQLRGAAREVAVELRFARAQAIATGREQTFEINVGDKRWSSAGKRQGTLPAELEVIATTAREEQPARETAVIRFFPEGASTGGRVVLKRGDAAWRIDVGWLTGEVTLSRGEGRP